MKSAQIVTFVALVSALMVACSNKTPSALTPNLSGTRVAASQDGAAADTQADPAAVTTRDASPADFGASGSGATIPASAAPLAGSSAPEPAADASAAAGSPAIAQPSADAGSPDAAPEPEEEPEHEDDHEDREDD